jgi:uncharacterized protein (DUF433 family)
MMRSNASAHQGSAPSLPRSVRGKERITSSPDVLGGEPVFRGTRIRLEHVAALFRKHVPDEEIAEDFPALDERDLAYARLAARLGQPPGRPKKRLRIEREPGAGC